MYGHPNNPDPWAEVQEIPPEALPPEVDSAAFIVSCLVVALPVGVIAFTLGYMSGVWGWFV